MNTCPFGETTLEIDLNALAHNYRYLKSHLDEGTKMMGVVKAFAYGSDSTAIAKELVDLGVAYLAVAYPYEGEVLRDAGIQTPILVLHPLPPTFETITARCMEPAIYSRTMLESFIAFCEEKKFEAYPIHIKLNTGLNRLGFIDTDIDYISETVLKSEAVTVKSIFSHLAASEDLKEKHFTEKQLKFFKDSSERLIENLGYTPLRHTLNTSGVINYPEAQYDMVRTGIGLYGFGNIPEADKKLRPVGTLKTVISQIHKVKKGESIGYNRGHIADRDMRSATLPLGHADGMARIYGNGNGWVTINGKRAPILGNTCMDMIMVDVTEIDCKEGDVVIIFGENPRANELAEIAGTISYELITSVSQRIKRVICRK
ncbi:alanine racemase [Flavobacteriaceae bacterium TK19130]|nr:alanine racemase [Thermobacterium salinum]